MKILDKIKELLNLNRKYATIITNDLTKTYKDPTPLEIGLYTNNEARAYIDKESLPGGDHLIVNGTMIRVEQVGKQYDSKNINEEEIPNDKEFDTEPEGGDE